MSNIITMNRGDSFSFDIVIDDETATETSGYYVLTEDDTLYVGLMLPHQPFEDALIKKKFTADDQDPETYAIEVKFSPSDTVDLFPGVYYYAVKLVKYALTDDEEVQTIINKAKFVIND